MTGGVPKSCPFCGSNEATVQSDPELGSEAWNCIWCGRFALFRPYTNPNVLTNDQRNILRGLSAERKVRREGPLEVHEDNLPILLTQGPATPADQADRFLLNLALKSSEPGVGTAFTSRYDGGLAFAAAHDAVIAWLDFLKNDGLIEYTGGRSDERNNIGFRLTLEGWRRVRELQAKGAASDAGFVAMSFAPEFDRLWSKGILPAFETSRRRAVRADRTEHTDRIDDWIMNQIRDCRFLLAETTASNAGVCFEAGYALGLRRPVIWIVREDSMAGLHFDIRQYNHLKWKAGEEEQLAPRLAQRIMSLVGEGRRRS